MSKLSLNDFVSVDKDSILSSLDKIDKNNSNGNGNSNSNGNGNEESTTQVESLDNIDVTELEQSVVVVCYGEKDGNDTTSTTTTTSSTTTENCNNNNNNEKEEKEEPIVVKKKKVNHNVGHIISLCIEVTHIVNKSKNHILRDIVDECCSGQWDDVVVPKLRQEISYRNTKPIGTVSMRKGRKGAPTNPFANIESFPNTQNGVPIPPTEMTSKFFF